jgi:hypothetical protein
MLTDKIDWNRKKKKSNFSGFQGTAELKLIRQLTQRQSNQSKNAQIVKYWWQILKSSGKGKAKRSFTVTVITPKGTEEKVTLKSTTGMACLYSSMR